MLPDAGAVKRPPPRARKVNVSRGDGRSRPGGSREVGYVDCAHETRKRQLQPSRRRILLPPRHHVGGLDRAPSARGESMFRTKAKRNTVVRASYACEKWPCQTPSHGSDACGLGSQRTVAKEAEGLESSISPIALLLI